MAMEPATKRQRIDGDITESAVDEIGSGLPVTKPPRHVPHGYNNNYTVRLTYADNFLHHAQQNGTGGIFQIFRMNSIFDPDQTGTGHQPMMRDLWASQYDYYTVISCQYQIKMFNCSGQDPVTFTAVGTSGQTIGCCNVSFLSSTQTTDISTPVGTALAYPHLEMKNAITDWLPPQKSVTFTGTLTQGDFIMDAAQADSDTTWTAVGSNPAVPRYFGYNISPATWSALTGVSETPYSSIAVQVILNYTVQFTQVATGYRQVNS
jgi:hypothetical protein